MDVTRQQLVSDGLYDTYRNEFLRCRLNLLQGMYDYIKPEYKDEAMAIIKERLDNDARTYLSSEECECGGRTKMFFRGYFMDSAWDKAKYDTLMKIRSIYRWIKE